MDKDLTFLTCASDTARIERVKKNVEDVGLNKTLWVWSLSKKSVFVILRLDRGIQNVLKRLDSRLRGNDDFLWKCQFLDKLCVPTFSLERTPKKRLLENGSPYVK